MPNERKVILYIAMSLDGYIAGPNDDLSFLDVVDTPGEDFGYYAFIATVDTIIIGRKTYDWVINKVGEFPHKDTLSYVITRTPREAIGKTNFYTGSIKALVDDLKKRDGKNIFVDGGAEIVNELLREDLIDEYYVQIIPVLLGDGVRLSKDGRPTHVLKLVDVKGYERGLVQLHYLRTSTA